MALVEDVWSRLGGRRGGIVRLAKLLNGSRRWAQTLLNGETRLRPDQQAVLEWTRHLSTEDLLLVELQEQPKPEPEPEPTPAAETQTPSGDLFERSQRIRRELEIRDRRISAKLDRALKRVEQLQETHDQTLRLLMRINRSSARAQEASEEQISRLVTELRPTESGRLLAVLDPSALKAGAGDNGAG